MRVTIRALELPPAQHFAHSGRQIDGSSMASNRLMEDMGTSERFEGRDQYTTIVRSKPSQMVLNHPKLGRPQR
jgi:hypothetical protein